MKDLMGLMKQAKEMQKKMEIAQGLVADIVVEGRSGSGLVSIELVGGGNMKTLKIDPSLFGSTEQDDVEMAEDLIVACLLYTSPSPRDGLLSRMPSSA